MSIKNPSSFEEAEALCIEKCGRAEDLKISDLVKIFPERSQKTLNNDVNKSKLMTAGRSGKFLLFTHKEVFLYAVMLGKWQRGN